MNILSDILKYSALYAYAEIVEFAKVCIDAFIETQARYIRKIDITVRVEKCTFRLVWGP